MLEPGKAVFPDQFIKQADMDERMKIVREALSSPSPCRHEEELAELKQTSGELCPKCYWRGKRGGDCEFCENSRLREAVEELEEITLHHADSASNVGSGRCECELCEYFRRRAGMEER